MSRPALTDWHDLPARDTPIDRVALRALEAKLLDYAEETGIPSGATDGQTTASGAVTPTGRILRPTGTTENGIVIVSPGGGWDTNVVYGEAQALMLLGPETGDIQANSIRARLSNAGGLGLGDGIHVYTGLHNPAGFPTPTQGIWIQGDLTPAAVGVVITDSDEPLLVSKAGTTLLKHLAAGSLDLRSPTSADDVYHQIGRGAAGESVWGVAAGAGHFAANAAAGDTVLKAFKSGGGTLRLGGMDSDLGPSGFIARLLVKKDRVLVNMDDVASTGRLSGGAGFFTAQHESASAFALAMDTNGTLVLNAASSTYPLSMRIANTERARIDATGLVIGSGYAINAGAGKVTNLANGSASDDAAAFGQIIAKAIGTTKGDQIGFTASATPVRHAIGADDTVQTADAAQSDGWKWAKVKESSMDTGSAGLAKGLVSAYRHAALNLAANGVVTLIPWDTEDADVSGWHDTASNVGRYTPQVAGYYAVSATVQTNGVALGKLQQAYIYKNGALYKAGPIAQQAINANNLGMSVEAIVPCNGSTDYIEIYALQSDTAARAMIIDVNNHLEIRLIGRS